MLGFGIPTNPFGSPNIIAVIAILMWIPAVLYLFTQYSAQRAFIITIITGWLFLPEIARSLPSLPDYSKMSATMYGILLATAIYHPDRFQTFKLGLLDIPMLIWWICPSISSITNGLGLYDAVSALIGQTAYWALPYLLGRIYVSDLAGLRQLAVGIAAGGVAYAPFCLFESRMSPQLHRIIYGAHASGDFSQAIRLGGYRPTVFMSHGLAVGAWMMVATLAVFWLWQTKVIKKLWNIEVKQLAIIVIIAFILLKSTGAYALFTIGALMIFSGKYLKTSLLVFVIASTIVWYLYISSCTETYITDQIIERLSSIFPPERVGSLEYRFNNEEILVDRAKQQLIFGWGGWGRALATRPWDGKATVQDSLWIIAFGHHGLVGLFSWIAVMLLPVYLVCIKYPARTWTRPEIAPLPLLAVGLLLYTLDCLQNAMINPIYIITAAGLTGFLMKPSALKQLPSRQKLKQQSVNGGVLAVRRSS